MSIKDKYIVEFTTLVNNNQFNFDEYAKSSIFTRRLLNYLDTIGYGYGFRKIMRLFIRKEEGYLEKVKLILGDLKILEAFQLEDRVVYGPNSKILYEREVVLNDIEDSLLEGKSFKPFDFSIYLAQVNNTVKNNKVDINTALMCEELLMNMPIITDSMASCVSQIYERGIYTKKSPKIIKRIGISYNNKNVTPKQLLIESYGRNFDLTFINKLIKLYDYNKSNDDLDEVINRVINSDKYYFTEKLIPIVYDFHKRYSDLNSLDKIVEGAIKSKISLKKIGITENKINDLIQFYTTMDKRKEKKGFIMTILNEYEDIR